LSHHRRIPAIALAATLWAAPALASHPQDFAQALPATIISGDFSVAEKKFLKDAGAPGRNQLLYLYEMAGLYRLKGEYEKSLALFDLADKVAQGYEAKAVASVTGGAAQAGASLSNDTVLPWEGACFDKVMSRTLNALNFIAKKNLEGAKVEVKKAEEYQVRERERIQKAVDKAGKKDEAAPVALTAKFSDMYSYVKNVRNSYENAFTYYLSSQIYCAYGKDGYNDALVDIKRAYELAPDSPAVRNAYLDIVAEALDPAALEEAKARLGVTEAFQPVDHAKSGTVVVIFEAGLAPQMTEVAIDLPVAGKLFSMAFPIYRDFGSIQPPLRIASGDLVNGTSRVVDLRPLAVKSLQERMPGILTRGTLGAAAKIAVQKETEKKLGFFGGLAATVLTKVVTNADLRSWLSLPAEVQAAQLSLPAGANELTLSAYDWAEKVKVDVVPGTYTFVTVRGLPGFKTIHVANVKAES
jgi:hypothetical protein